MILNLNPEKNTLLVQLISWHIVFPTSEIQEEEEEV